MSGLLRRTTALPAALRAVLCITLLVMAACSGGGSEGGVASPASPSEPPPAPPPEPVLMQVHHWDFNAVEDWLFEAAPATAAQVWVQDGGLQLHAGLIFIHEDQPTCPLASAQVLLTDSRITSGSLNELVLDMDVSLWSLGLGRFDTDVPRLELVIAGKRHQLRVSGFKVMPGKVRAVWTPDSGFSYSIDGGTSFAGTDPTPDSGPPLLRLWIDGCSEGMNQFLTVEAMTVSVR